MKRKKKYRIDDFFNETALNVLKYCYHTDVGEEPDIYSIDFKNYINSLITNWIGSHW